MKLRSLLLAAICLSGLGATAFAETIDYFTGTVGTAHTEAARLSRSGTAQTWLGAESFSGTVTTTAPYYYTTYTYSAASFIGAPYVEVSVFDELNSAGFFVSAYYNSYDPTNLGKNYLGDEGSSGNIQFFPTDPGDPRFFQVILPANSSLILVVNTTPLVPNSLVGTTSPYDIAINAYADTQYNDPVAPVAVTPEPSTFIELGTGLLAMAGVARRKFRFAV